MKQETDLTTYSVNKNFRALLGNPWRMVFDVPSIDGVDLTTFKFALLVYNSLGKLLHESRYVYESPVDITLPSSITERFSPGIYSYFLIALYGTGNTTVNYTIASGVISSLSNMTLDGTLDFKLMIPTLESQEIINEKTDGK